MAKLISVEAASELLDTTKSSIMTTACVYKKATGKYPKWYISNAKRGAGRSWVDMEQLDKNRQLIRSIWIMATEHLYYIMSYDFNMTDDYIAKQLTKRSKVYTTETSWRSFLQNSLFTLPPETVYTINKSMLLEFLIISKRIIALALRK